MLIYLCTTFIDYPYHFAFSVPNANITDVAATRKAEDPIDCDEEEECVGSGIWMAYFTSSSWTNEAHASLAFMRSTTSIEKAEWPPFSSFRLFVSCIARMLHGPPSGGLSLLSSAWKYLWPLPPACTAPNPHAQTPHLRDFLLVQTASRLALKKQCCRNECSHFGAPVGLES